MNSNLKKEIEKLEKKKIKLLKKKEEVSEEISTINNDLKELIQYKEKIEKLENEAIGIVENYKKRL